MKGHSMMLSTVRVLAIAAAFFGLQAQAQVGEVATGPRALLAQATADPDAVFTRLDANKDGGIDMQESARLPGLSAAFGEADANKDGKLDKSELSAALQKIK